MFDKAIPARRRVVALATVPVLILGVVLACFHWWRPGSDVLSGRRQPAGPSSAAGVTLKILASTELRDLGPILAGFTQQTGIPVTVQHVETRAGERLVMQGRAGGVYDAVWFSSQHDISSSASPPRVVTGRTVMTSPVLLGLRRSVALRLGWADRAVGWEEIARAAGQGRFTFGMTAPEYSDCGRAAVLATATGLAGVADVPTESGLDKADPGLRAMFTAQRLTAANPRELSDAFLRRPTKDVDGLFTYESEILRLNAEIPRLNAAGTSAEPLVPIYPSDYVVSGTYTLSSLLPSRSLPGQDAVAQLTDYLLQPRAQQEILNVTHRRPMSQDVVIPPPQAKHPLLELRFPRDDQILDRLVNSYLNRYRRPARTVFLLDTSKSMRHHNRLTDLNAAVRTLTGDRTATATSPDRIRAREQVVLLAFSSTPHRPAVVINVPERDSGKELQQIRSTVAGLRASGGTAIYDSLIVAYQEVARLGSDEPDRMTSIVLITDGDSTMGRSRNDFMTFRKGLPRDLQAVPVYPILVGEADASEMGALAKATGGRTLAARDGNLSQAFRTLRERQ